VRGRSVRRGEELNFVWIVGESSGGHKNVRKKSAERLFCKG